MKPVLLADGKHDRTRCKCEECVDWRDEMENDARPDRDSEEE